MVDWPSELSGAVSVKKLPLAQKWNPPEDRQIAIAFLGLARLYADAGDFDRALQFLDTAKSKNPSDGEIDSARGTVLAQSGRWREAAEVLKEVLARNPNDEAALRSLGNVAWQGKHDYAGAINYLERALRLPGSDVTRASIENSLGSVYCEIERCGEGIGHLRQAVQLQPGDPEYHANFANALIVSGHVEEAKEQLSLAIRIDPKFEVAKATLAKLLQGHQ